mmetsp:Transcript_303/g.1288  ORF Transcript_303/g.1288 Transcript_303/m.1288 type:complete len:244 (-) Transcript_303:115-846(-)
MHRVHKESFKRGVFDIKREMDGDADAEIVCWMLRGVGIFWVLMGLFFYCQSSYDDGAVTLWFVKLPGEGVDHVQLPFVGLVVPVPLVWFCASLALSFGLLVTSWMFGRGGMLEIRIWRTVGYGGQVFLICLVRCLACSVLMAALIRGPGLEWKRQEVPHHEAAAFLLWILAASVLIAAWLTRLALQRKARASSSLDLSKLLDQGRCLNWDDLESEEGTHGILEMTMDNPTLGTRFGRMKSSVM